MKLKTTLLAACLGAFLFAGCSSDSEDLNNAFTFENTTYKFNDATIIDDGLFDLTNDGINNNTHYSYIFWMTDGNVTVQSNYLADSATYALIVFAYAPINNDSEGFSEGVFKYVGDQDFYEGNEDLEGNYLFSFSYMCFDEDGDGVVGYDEDIRLMTDGIHRIFGNEEKFDLNFTYNFSLGKKAEGRFSGPIAIYEP